MPNVGQGMRLNELERIGVNAHARMKAREGVSANERVWQTERTSVCMPFVCDR
jgi:hypothetical protein